MSRETRDLASQMGVTTSEAVEAFRQFSESAQAAHDKLMETQPLYRERMAWVTAPWYARIWWCVSGRKRRLDETLRRARFP